MNAGAFAVVGLLYSRRGARHEIEELAGWGYRYPLLGGCLAICMLSLGGIPPTMGFLGKYLVFQQAVAAGHPPRPVLGGRGRPARGVSFPRAGSRLCIRPD